MRSAVVRERRFGGPCQEGQIQHVLGGLGGGKFCFWGRGRESHGGELLSFILPKESNQREDELLLNPFAALKAICVLASGYALVYSKLNVLIECQFDLKINRNIFPI